MTRPARWRLLSLWWMAIGAGMSQLDLPTLTPNVEEVRLVLWVLTGLAGFVVASHSIARYVVAAMMMALLAERIIPLVLTTIDGTRPTGWFSALIWLGVAGWVQMTAAGAKREDPHG